MPVTLDPAHRAQGLIYLNSALVDQPATHVLLVGIGRFASDALPQLTSPPASARAMAAWFLGDAGDRAGFANPERPLGSLALVLSEGDGPAEAEGGPVPEATFANVQVALRAWITRAGRNAQSAAVLFMASHGQADMRRTAIVLQDYGGDPLDPFAGMTEVEQLARALTTLDPVDKLLIFDCCRTKIAMDLSDERSFGMPMIGGRVTPAGFMGIRPNILRSTRFGTVAYGGGGVETTLFTGALLDALSGMAASPSDDWRIYSSELSSTAEEIMRLWQEDGEPIQVPAYESEGKVPIAQIAEPAVVPFFLALPPDHDITTARFRLYRGDATVPEADVAGPSDGRPFVRFGLEELVPYRVTAHDAAGALIGEMTVKTRMPRMIKTLPLGALPGGGLQVTRAKSADAAATGVAVQVNTQWVQGQVQAPVIRVARVEAALPPMPTPAAPAPFEDGVLGFAPGDRFIARRRPPAPAKRVRHKLEQVVPDATGLRLASGQWIVRASRPGAPDVETMIDVEDGDEVTLNLPGLQTGHEWLMPAVAAAVISDKERGSDASNAPTPAPALMLHGTDGKPLAEVSAQRGPADGRFAVFHFDDGAGERFAMRQTGPQNSPVWADFRGDGWRERCFVPLQGALASFGFYHHDGTQDPWQAEVLVDDHPPHDRSHVAGYAMSGSFGPLLAFLARRSFLNAGAALRVIAADMPLRDAVMGKVGNPLAALAAAQIAVATGQTAELDIPDTWMENLANWFPTLPDGPVILGRHRQRQGQPCADQFAEAQRRGVPVFSLTQDWLSEGLELTGHPEAAAVRARTLRTDPTRAFTVIRLAKNDP